MDRIPEVLEDTFIYGSGALPATNFFLSEYPTHKTWKHFALVFKNIWSGNYSRALEHIDIAVKTCSQDSAKYILLAKKLFLLSLTSKLDRSLFLLLKRSVNRLSQRSRDIVLCTLLNMEAKGISPVRCTRVWSSKYQKDTPGAAFVHINLARRYASQKRLSDSVHHFVKAYRIASSIPHPSGIITALNGIAWDIRKRHPKFAYKFAKVAVYYLGFFRENFGNLAGVLDSLFDIENRMKSQEIYKTAIVVSYLKLPDRYKKLKERAKQLLPSFSENTYKNTRKLRNFLKKILGPYRSESLSPSRTSEIVTG
ncbi:MAG: hypothetical protein J7L34_04165, partial [Thermotogaceae bacterium]|nr:hypothetical protein [Thermotogaceae bacterium]